MVVPVTSQRLVFLQQMLQIEYFAHRDRLLVTTVVFLCNGYHAGKYSMDAIYSNWNIPYLGQYGRQAQGNSHSLGSQLACRSNYDKVATVADDSMGSSRGFRNELKN